MGRTIATKTHKTQNNRQFVYFKSIKLFLCVIMYLYETL